MKVDNNTYIFSDPHYGHKNFVAGETSWFYSEDRTEEEIRELRWRRTRPFHTLDEMNDTIVKNINSTVPENATLICLGDWSFGGIENIWNFRKRINCKDIHLILGNHDHHIEGNGTIHISNDNSSDLKNLGIPFIRVEMWNEDGAMSFKHDKLKVNVQDLFTSVSHYKEISFKKEGHRYDIILSHYAMRVWNKSHRGSIMLYGHSHGTLDEMNPLIANPTWIGDDYYTKNYRTMDVGMDTNNLYPYHIEEIVDIMVDRPTEIEIDYDRNRPRYEN